MTCPLKVEVSTTEIKYFHHMGHVDEYSILMEFLAKEEGYLYADFWLA